MKEVLSKLSKYIFVPKILINAILTLLLILNWIGISDFIKTIAWIWLIYSFIKLAIRRFTAIKVWFKFILAIILLALVHGLISSKYYILVILLLWTRMVFKI